MSKDLETMEKLEKEHEEIKKIIASMLNCIATISEQTSLPAMMQIEGIINYCNKLDMFKNQD